jgi:hypothetical protein
MEWCFRPLGHGYNINRAVGDFQLSLFCLANPASGNQNLVVSWSGGTYTYSIEAVSFKGVNQATPCINGTTNTATGTSLSLSVTSPTGDIAVGAFGSTVAYGTVNQTQIFQDTTSSFPVAAANYVAGSGAASLTATTNGGTTTWIAFGLDVKAN